jgi:glycosyltransferase involved in cell wall biosynthesis
MPSPTPAWRSGFFLFGDTGLKDIGNRAETGDVSKAMELTPSKVLILIPAYNAANYLPRLVPRIRHSVPDSDLLIINDGSSDNTAELLPTLGITCLENVPNQGKGFTLKRGADYALEKGYRHIVTIDADLQHLPEEIPRLLEKTGRSDIVIGTRKITLRVMPFARWLTNNLTSIIISVFSGQRVRDSQSGFRLIATEILAQTKVQSVKYDYESELLFQAGALGARIGEAAISTVYEGSHSYINPLKDTGRFIRQIWKRILL